MKAIQLVIALIVFWLALLLAAPFVKAGEAHLDCVPVVEETARATRDFGTAVRRLSDPVQVAEAGRFFNDLEPLTRFRIDVALIGDQPDGRGLLLLGHDGLVCWRYHVPRSDWRDTKTRILGTRDEGI